MKLLIIISLIRVMRRFRRERERVRELINKKKSQRLLKSFDDAGEKQKFRRRGAHDCGGLSARARAGGRIWI
jgi:hypothetical protein